MLKTETAAKDKSIKSLVTRLRVFLQKNVTKLPDNLFAEVESIINDDIRYPRQMAETYKRIKEVEKKGGFERPCINDFEKIQRKVDAIMADERKNQ